MEHGAWSKDIESQQMLQTLRQGSPGVLDYIQGCIGKIPILANPSLHGILEIQIDTLGCFCVTPFNGVGGRASLNTKQP